MCKMMRKIASMHKMMRKVVVMRKMMRKMMRKIAFTCMMMRKMKISSSEGEHSRTEQDKTFIVCQIKTLLFRIGPFRFRRNHTKY